MLSIPKRRIKKIDASINIVPYIDVMLVLLVIFMMTTPIIEQGIDVDLPISGIAEMVDFSNAKPTIVSINKAGKYFINSFDVDNDNEQDFALNIITARIKARLGIYPNMQIFVRGDRGVKYGLVVDLMSFLQKNNIGKVGLLTETINE